MSEPVLRRRYRLFGAVQGVGLRWRLRHAAETLGLAGWVRNEPDGSVTLELQGTEAGIDRALQTLEQSRWIRIESLEQSAVPPIPEERRFSVLDDRW